LLALQGIGISLLLLEATPGCADEFDTVNYTATAGVNYDSNVFRLPSGTDPQLVIGKAGKSDRIRLVSLGIDIDKKYSNQELQLDAKVTNNKYNAFSILDYNGTTYKAAWNWSLTSKLSGTISDVRTQTLNSFADIQTNTRNLNTDDSRRLNGDWWMQSDWHVLFAAAIDGSSNSLTTINSLSYRNQTGELGLKYAPATNNSIALISRNIKGSYINGSPDYVALIDTGYRERQDDLQINWQLTDKSGLNGNLMNVKRRYPLFVERDYDGLQGGISYAWGMTDKTHLNTSINRSINSWFDTSSSYYVTDTVSLSPAWQISSKTDMHLVLSRNLSSYRGAVIANALTRQDVNQSIEIGAGWSPQRAVTFSASVQHTWRDSNFMAYGFSDNIASLSVAGTF